MNKNLEELRFLKESEDHIEFKEAKNNFNVNGGTHADPKKRRHCILGYIVALANEGGGRLVFGMADKYPHDIVGTKFELGKLGNLEDYIYENLSIRVRIDEEYDNENRVLIFNIPSRPIGRMLKFEGVPLMRVGESLREMSDEEMLKVLSEQEVDFSAKICEGLTYEDLDEDAIRILKNRYAEKNNNPNFELLPNEQVLKDLELSCDGNKYTYAALILLGKKRSIKKYLPHNNVVIEYRRDPASIQYDARIEIQEPLYKGIEQVWNYINQPALNPMMHVRMGAYIYDIFPFNQDTIREAILNAIVHRSFQIKNDVVIKLSTNELIITNAGGFPLGVNLKNLLTINSTPRSKQLVDVLQKTGLVEKSGQGVDKMFYNCIMESKLLPDYSKTDNYQVELRLSTSIQNKAFLMFIRQEQYSRPIDKKLNIFELLILYKISRKESVLDADSEIIYKLEQEKLIKVRKNGSIVLSDKYNDYEKIITNQETAAWKEALKKCFANSEYMTRKQLSEALSNSISVNQLRYLLQRLEDSNTIKREGMGKGTRYILVNKDIDALKL